VRRYKQKSVEVDVFSKGVGHFERKFQTKGVSPTNRCWCQQTRVIALSRGIKYPQYIVWFCHIACV